MKRVFVCILALFTGVALSGCGLFDTQTDIEKDREEQREILSKEKGKTLFKQLTE